MEIALTGFNPQYGTGTSVNVVRQRQRPQQDAQQRQSSSANQRESENQNSQTRAQTSQRTPAQSSVESTEKKARVINGEVLSSETTRVYTRDAGTIILPRTAANQQSSTTGQPSNRRIPVEQAIQTFRDNESLVLDKSNPRQVSGIIDEYV